MPTNTQLIALAAVCKAVLEAIQLTGDQGAPGGVLYAGLTGFGCNINQFESLMAALIRTGKIRKSGDLYFAVGA